MSFMNPSDTVFSKYPSDIQLRLRAEAGYVYVPITSLSWEVAKEITAEHYSGTGLPCNLTEGNTDYSGSLETGWVTNNPDDAQLWEYLLYTYLINPVDQGRSVEFDIELHERVYTGKVNADGEEVVGGQIWASFRRCKIEKHNFSVSEGSVAKRSYNWKGLRGAWGEGGEDTGGQG
jgi:hypothetical protein